MLSNGQKKLKQEVLEKYFLQCVDTDGRQRGFDIELAKQVVDSVNIPVVVGQWSR